MFIFERKARDQVLRNLDDDQDAWHLNDRELFTTALNQYLALPNPERDMYRETLDDLMDFVKDKKPFALSPPKYRNEGKYYVDYYRGDGQIPRSTLRKRRGFVLQLLESYSILKMPYWSWQTFFIITLPYKHRKIFVNNAHSLRRLQEMIGDFEDRCMHERKLQIVSRIFYDEIFHNLMEEVRGEEPRMLRDFKNGKMPERFFLCLFKNRDKVLTYEQVYEKMGISEKKKRKTNKNDRHIARWRDEKRLDAPDISGKYIHWIEPNKLRFTPIYKSDKP